MYVQWLLSFHVLYACLLSLYQNYWTTVGSQSQSCREVGLRNDHTSMTSDTVPVTVWHCLRLVVCSLAVITPSVLSTVSRCYLSDEQIITIGGFVLFCAHLCRVDCVMTRV